MEKEQSKNGSFNSEDEEAALVLRELTELGTLPQVSGGLPSDFQ